MRSIRKSFWTKVIAVFLALTLTFDFFLPSQLMALTGGPSQPEVQSFMPVSVSDMVDMSSGDFQYNIPLFQVGDYPINLIYNGGISADQEASWVGLGWNLNPGVINRQMRTLPDDFKGDEIKSELSMKDNNTYGLSVMAPSIEISGFSFINLSFSLGVSYNNYTGVGFSKTVGVGLNLHEMNAMEDSELGLVSITAGLDGPLSIRPDLSLSKKVKEKDKEKDRPEESKDQNADPPAKKEDKKKLTIRPIDNTASGKYDVSGVSLGNYIMNTQGHTPSVNHPMQFTPLSVKVALGAGLFLIDGQPTSLYGYFNGQKVKEKSITQKAYGYNFLQHANSLSMMDFHRDNDVNYKRTIPLLPNPVIGYDTYQVNGQGIGGSFRPHRSDFGALYDPHVTNSSLGGSLGLEVNLGNAVDVGFDVQVNTAESYTKKWTDLNNMSDIARFKYASDVLSEPYYFKFLGDMPFDTELEDIREKFLGNRAVRIKLNAVGAALKEIQSETYTYEPFGIGSMSRDFSESPYPKREKRVKRKSMISQLSAAEVETAGLTGWKNPYSKDHHIAEISVTQENGSRYIYGRPAYNISQKEMNFNVSTGSENTVAKTDGKIYYDASTASTANSKGLNNYFSSKTIPPYAHSYLITGVLSADYVDSDGIRGPSPGDYGNYTAFQYDAPYSYKWRTPYGQDTAFYNEGVQSLHDDDMGSVVEGVKELHYVREIRSKDQIAVFRTSLRTNDSRESGGTQAMKQLDRIDIYSLPEYEALYSNAVPLKSVHFIYAPGATSLCPGILNPAGGAKLTLHQVYFTYGKSNLSSFNKYEFSYDQEANYEYEELAYDMWGNYKPVDATSGNPATLTNSDFPYVPQNFAERAEMADTWAAAWSLKTIKLPSGGLIEIDLEADDYTHVQNKRAMQMLQITSVEQGITGSTGNKLYAANNPYEYVHYTVPPGQYLNVDNEEDVTLFNQRCITPLISAQEPVYFNFSVDVLNNGQKDRVPGYFRIEEAGGSGSNGWVRLKQISMQGGIIAGQAHPVSQAAWNFAKIHHPKKAYGYPEITAGGNAINYITAIATSSLIGSILQTLVAGPDHKIRSANFGTICYPEESWFAVLAPETGKIGGGARVKEIRIRDNWREMTNNTSNKEAAYGQKYTYKLQDGVTSSGVASWEPNISKENPFVRPAYYKEERALVPAESYYLELPVGKSFYPAPKVTYSRVEVESLYLEDNGSGSFADVSASVTNHSNGYAVHEFYTTKDFPTKSSATGKDKSNQLLGALLGKLFSFYTFYWESVSQGMYVETNDMDGKPKAVSNYNSSGVLISKTEYKYQTQAGEESGLDNKILVVDKNLSVRCEEVGVEMDLYHDFRENRSNSKTVGMQPNIGTFFLFFPIVVPAIFPDINVNETIFRSAVTMKTVHRHGILSEIKTFNQGAEVVTRNLAYDQESGEVLLSSVTNEFNEELFSFAFPAHWRYPAMGGAYENEGAQTNLGVNSNGAFPNNNNTSNFHSGDEVLVENTSTNEQSKAWVLRLPGQNARYLIDRDGLKLPSATYKTKIIRSSRRNMQGIAMGSMTTLNNPLGNNITPKSICEGSGTGQISFSGPGTKVLAASATTYSDQWKTFVAPEGASFPEGCYELSEVEWGQLQAKFIKFMVPYLAQADINTEYVVSLNSPPFNYFTTLLGKEVAEVATQDMVFSISQPVCDPSTLTYKKYNNGFSCFLSFQSGCLSEGYAVWGWTTSLGGGLAVSDGLPVDPEIWESVADVIFVDYWPEQTNNGYALFQLILNDGSVQPFRLSRTSFVLRGGDTFDCTPQLRDTVNPYVAGILGNWRVQDQYAYKGERDYNYDASVPNSQTNTRDDGYFSNNFNFFWNYQSNNWQPISLLNSGWISSLKVTEYNPYSTEVENQDALGRYSAAVYGYNHKVPVCVGSNATYQQIGFDSFEDYGYYDCQAGCFKRHFAFEDYSANVTTEQSHTGYHSIKIPHEEYVEMKRKLTSQFTPTPNLTVPYVMHEANDIGVFGPETDDMTYVVGDYLISYWVKELAPASGINTSSNFDNHHMRIRIGTSEVNYGAEKRSPVIDGWQRVERVFYIPNMSAGELKITFEGSTEGTSERNVYIDDVRVHPFRSSFKSFVYDYRSLRLMAELDDNNFATLYEYDLEGNLVRVKKETEKGISTLQEYRKDMPLQIP